MRQRHRAGNVIPLPMERIEKAARTLYNQATTEISYACQVAEGKTIGDVLSPNMVLSKTWMTLQHVKGHTFKVNIYLLSGHKVRINAIQGGTFVPDRGDVLVYVAKNVLLCLWPTQPDSITEQITDVLSHELSHAADVFSSERYRKTLGQDADAPHVLAPFAYYNIPTEVRAYTQEIVRQLLRALEKHRRTDRMILQLLRKNPAGGGELLDHLLLHYTAYPDVARYWYEPNRKRAVKAAAHALTTALTSSRSRLP